MALTVLTSEIPSSQALSSPIEISHGLRIVRIGMPSDWSFSADHVSDFA
jgi:hypothetical protein